MDGTLRAATFAMAISVILIAGCTPDPDITATAQLSPPAQTLSPPTLSPAPTETDRSVGPLVTTPLTVAEGTDPGAAKGQSLEIPEGWTAEVWANVPDARLATWSPDGTLLVSSAAQGTVTALTPTTPGKAPTAKIVVEGLDGPQGLGFALNGKLLVVGESTEIVTFDYRDGVARNKVVLVGDLPTGGHGAKGIAINGDTVYYSLGSSGNRVPRDRDANPQRATLWQVGVQGQGNSIVATGVRNGMALAIAPDRTLFTAVNQMDNQPYPYDDGSGNYAKTVREYINENPVDQVTRVTTGVELGWPFCVPDPRNSPGLLRVPYVNDPAFNPNGELLDCGSLPSTMLGLPAHSAPLGLSFTANTGLESVIGSGALITTHGSWNREVPRAPGVAFSPWDSARNTLGATVPLVGGFQSDAGDRWGRCVDALVGPDGSMYVTDDAAGLVYRISPPSSTT